MLQYIRFLVLFFWFSLVIFVWFLCQLQLHPGLRKLSWVNAWERSNVCLCVSVAMALFLRDCVFFPYHAIVLVLYECWGECFAWLVITDRAAWQTWEASSFVPLSIELISHIKIFSFVLHSDDVISVTFYCIYKMLNMFLIHLSYNPPPSPAPPFIETCTLVDGQIFSFMRMWKKEIILKKKEANMHKSGLQSIFFKKCSNSHTTWLMEFLYPSPLEGFRNVLCLWAAN